MLHDINLALSGLKFAFKVNRKIVSLKPDTLYQHFIIFSPLLPINAIAWSFSLTTLFYNALSFEL